MTRRPYDQVSNLSVHSSQLTDSVQKLIDESDLVVECCGDVIHVTEVCLQVLNAGIPIVTMDSELHVTCGSWLQSKGIFVESEGDPIILDMATSAIAYYGLIEAKTAGKTLPEGLGYDKDGNPTNDPAEIMSGAIKTFGGHKGSGMALIVQIFAGALVQADSFNSDSDNAGNLVMAIDPEILTTKEKFTKEVSSIINRIKSAKKVDGVAEITIPGERASKFNKNVMDSGEIEVEDNLYKELQKAANQ